jgi:hypothetical protein
MLGTTNRPASAGVPDAGDTPLSSAGPRQLARQVPPTEEPGPVVTRSPVAPSLRPEFRYRSTSQVAVDPRSGR